MIGTRLGPYELREVIGQGGMATVYRAHQPSIDRDVAIKVIHPGVLHDAGAIDRFRREARLIARLEHPHILPVYDFDGLHSPPYIVMRYLDSGTLRDLLAQQRLPLTAINDLITQIAEALDYAHAQGIVHRDIKPSNILLDRHGNAFVADFGIARIVTAQANTERPITQTGAIIGTPDYMAPEQASASGDVDGRADIYALGVLLFQMLCGQLPYTAEQPLGVLLKHLQAPIPSARAIDRRLPTTVDALFSRALAKEPSARHPTAGALAAQLTALLKQHTASGATTQNLRALTSQLSPRTDAPASPTPTPSEQHKIVTALFVDATEYAELTEAELGAEASREALRVVRERVTNCVHERLGQIVTQSEHDLLALWGADTAHEDDAERAIRAALEIQAAMQSLRRATGHSEDDALPLRQGINTGVALISPTPAITGPTQRMSYTASGVTISLAQRLSAQADGEIIIGHDTFRAVRGIFDLELATPVRVRGRREPLAAYRVIAARPRAFRVTTRGIEGVETRLIGRDAELKQLQSAYLDAVEDSETQVVSIIGEAGLGKSRLLDAFDAWADLRPEQFRIFRGLATPAMTRRPYALIRDMLSYRFDILDTDPVSLARTKLEDGVADLLGEADGETAHLLGYLAGFDMSDSPHVRGLLDDPLQLSARARQLFIRLFARLSDRDPIVIELEDLHYADDPSLNLVIELTTSTPQLRLLMIALARPDLLERRPAWGSGQPFHRRMTLSPLDKRDSRELARELLQRAADVPKALRDLLVERSEGNPLYMEELVKMLLEDHIIIKETDETWRVEPSRLVALRVPPTLLGLLQARFDTLLAPEKLILQRAAVAGRVFIDSALLALDAADETHVGDLQRILQALVTRGFIERRETSSIAGGIEYSFTQAMLRDLIADTLVSRQRESYHRAMAHWLAASERADEYLPMIADHYERAGDSDQAMTILEQAGDKAVLLSALAEALASYKRAIALIDDARGRSAAGSISQRAAQHRQAALQIKHADVEKSMSSFAAACNTLQSALTIVSDDAMRAEALALLGAITTEMGEYSQAHRLLLEARTLAEASASQATLIRVLHGLGDVKWKLGELEEALNYLEESRTLAQLLGNIRAELLAINWIGAIKIQLDPGESEQLFQTHLKRAIALGNREVAMLMLNNLGEAIKARGDLGTARRLHQQAVDLAREIGSPQSEIIFRINVADDDTKLGNLSAARLGLQQCLKLAQSIGIVEMLAAIAGFSYLTAAEGYLDHALALAGLIYHHPMMNSDIRYEIRQNLANCGLDIAILTELHNGVEPSGGSLTMIPAYGLGFLFTTQLGLLYDNN
jgi:class 3 adenylate cyclase/tRNA A-37 threonylcarbamoyl transferase component Bud32